MLNLDAISKYSSYIRRRKINKQIRVTLTQDKAAMGGKVETLTYMLKATQNKVSEHVTQRK